MIYLLQQVLNGLHIGAIYALLGFGYALVNGVLHRTNLAHGALFGFAGQLTILGAVFGWQALWMTLPVSLAFGVVLGFGYALAAAVVLSRAVLEPLSRRSPDAVVAATLGVSLVLMELARVASETRDFWLPPLLSRPVVFASGNGFDVTLTEMQIVNGVLALAVLFGAGRWLAVGRFGRDWRSVCDDPLAAAFCGVDGAAVFRRSVVAGSSLAAIAGCMAAFYYGNIGFGAGLVFGLKVLFVTAAGGYVQPSRAAGGAFLFGIAESLWSGYFPLEWRDGWILALLAAFLILRQSATTGLAPRG